MDLTSAIYLLLGLSFFGLIVWLLVTYVAKVSPVREIVIALAVILLIFVLLQMYGPLLHGHGMR
jgi:hypothetical protein